MKKYLLVLLVLLFASGCAAPKPPAQTVSQPVATPKIPRPDHVVIVIEENKSYDDIIGSLNAPYINSLAEQGASLTKVYAFHHPSQPNYFAIFAGTHVIKIPGLNKLEGQYPILDDTCVPLPYPGGDKTKTPNLATTRSLGGLLLDKYPRNGFGGYAENWDPKNPSACPQPPTPLPPNYPYYAQKHAPWTIFKDSLAASYTFDEFPKTDDEFEKMPLVSIVIPDLINDMHTEPCDSKSSKPCSISEGKDIATLVKDGDDWLANPENPLYKYVNWAKDHNSLLIITWDESSSNTPLPGSKFNPHAEGRDYGYGFNWPQNRIPTIFIGEMVKPGIKSDVVYNHYDLLRTIEDMYGLRPYLGGSANAKDINDIWK